MLSTPTGIQQVLILGQSGYFHKNRANTCPKTAQKTTIHTHEILGIAQKKHLLFNFLLSTSPKLHLFVNHWLENKLEEEKEPRMSYSVFLAYSRCSLSTHGIKWIKSNSHLACFILFKK